MSGGFFRGTSTDQDTRFSNKKAKLLKSQKFAPELETLVDMTKVKMDVMRPWIAKRVTELIGFEDEVLINFIYGLLEGKGVNGKEIQISLTGFMERNTGKFMKELWLLLLSAQQNLSGVPQQFLDAKEEETKKKKAEADRIANEIQRKREKEKQELEQEKTKMDGVGEMLREHAEVELNLKPDPRVSNIHPADEEEQNSRKRLRGRSRVSRSPDPANRFSSPRQRHSTPPSKSFSNSRSYSDERQRSRSISKSPPSRSRSISSERQYPTSPRRRHVIRYSPSPSRRRSSHSKRRSISHSRRRSPSPTKYRVRSPRRYRSRSPLHRRSRSPRRWSRTPIRTSPARRRSPSPVRRRSPAPVHHRSPSPLSRRSPSPRHRRSPSPRHRRPPSPRHRRPPSPLSRRSPSSRHHRSPSPLHCRPRSPLRRRPQSLRRQSPSPVRRRYQRSSPPRGQSISPVQRGSSMLGQKRSLTPAPRRSPSPQEFSSRSPIRHGSLSPVRIGSPKSTRSPPQSPGERVRSREKHSSFRSASPQERVELSAKDHRGSKPVDHRPIISLRSPQRDMLDRNDFRGKEPASSLSMQKSSFVSGSSRERGYSEDRRSSSPRGSLHQRREIIIRPESPSPMLKTAEPKARRDSSGTSADDENFSTREAREHKYRSSGKIPPTPDRRKDIIDSAKIHILDDGSKSRKSQLTSSEKLPDRVNHKEREQQELSVTPKPSSRSEKGRESNVDEGDRAGDKNSAQVDDSKGTYQFQEPEVLPKLLRKSELNDRNGSMDLPSKETDEHRTKVKEKRKHKKSDRHEVESDDYSSYDSYEERKEAKRRRKEEKRLKKEERHRRRDERRRRKEERRAEKRKLKLNDTGSPSSDLERDHSEEESYRRRESRTSDNKEAKSEQKNLEIELREKALESLRAKKGIGN